MKLQFLLKVMLKVKMQINHSKFIVNLLPKLDFSHILKQLNRVTEVVRATCVPYLCVSPLTVLLQKEEQGFPLGSFPQVPGCAHVHVLG